MNTYTVELISRISDMSTTLSMLCFGSPEAAKVGAPRLMAAPDMWLVVRITDDATDEIVFGGDYSARRIFQ